MAVVISIAVFALAGLSGCAAVTETVAYSQPLLAQPIRRFALTVTCEHCSTAKLDTSVEEMVTAVLPCSKRVPALEAADITLHYSEGDSVICVDCDEEPLLRDWWWAVELYAPPAHKEQLFAHLSGSVHKMRGRPARFVKQQMLAFVGQQPWRCMQ